MMPVYACSWMPANEAGVLHKHLACLVKKLFNIVPHQLPDADLQIQSRPARLCHRHQVSPCLCSVSYTDQQHDAILIGRATCICDVLIHFSHAFTKIRLTPGISVMSVRSHSSHYGLVACAVHDGGGGGWLRTWIRSSPQQAATVAPPRSGQTMLSKEHWACSRRLQ